MNINLQALENTFVAFREQINSITNYDHFQGRLKSIITDIKDFLSEVDSIEVKGLNPDETGKIAYLKYHWSLEALDFSILLRDILLIVTKNEVIRYAQADQFDYDRDRQSQITISENLHNLLLDSSRDTSESVASILSEQPKEWFHQKSPVQIINTQLAELLIQIDKIVFTYHKVLPQINAFNEYREHLLLHNNFRIIHLRELDCYLVEAQALLEETKLEMTKPELAILSKSLQKISTAIEAEKVNSLSYEEFRSPAQEVEIPIYSDGGELFYRTVDLNKNVESWTDSEILPKILDADSDINSLFDSALISLFNTRNKVENLGLADQDVYIFEKLTYKRSIDKTIEDVNSYLESLDKTINELNTHAIQELQISNLYDVNKEFLPELGFINLTKFTGQKIWYESDTITSWRMKFSQIIKSRKIPYLSELNTDPYDFIQSKEIPPQDLDSNSLFLKKGYLGRSFYIERREVENEIVQAFDRWMQGYQGSVLLQGAYGSGKSSLLEYIPHLLTKVTVVSLQLHNSVQLQGRKMTVDYKVGETMNFLGKQSINNPVVVCMDDLEKWQHDEQTMYHTIRDIIEAIAKYGRRVFFVITCNHFMMDHIERLFDFKSRFASVVNLDRMYQKSIANALVVRHNASIREYNEEDNASLAKRAARIARKCRFNIGASMNAWERLQGREDIRISYPPPKFQQVCRKHALVLQIILAHKYLSESNLRQHLSSSDNNYISEELRKLRGFKLVSRTFDGFLQVNPDVVHDVEYCLKNRRD